MTPTSGGRFCGDCKKVVRHLSEMTEVDAKALLRGGSGEELCVRYLYDRQGSIVFADRKLLPASLLQRAKRAAAVAALPVTMAACSTPSFLSAGAQALERDDDTEEQLRSNMGGVSADQVRPPPPPPADAGTDAAADASADAEPDEVYTLMGGISADALDPPPNGDGGTDGGK
jgi:hypothetical protein